MSSRIQQAVRESQEQSEQALVDLKTEVTDLARGFRQMVDDEVHRNPWRVAGAVALVSLTAGFVLGRRTRRERR